MKHILYVQWIHIIFPLCMHRLLKSVINTYVLINMKIKYHFYWNLGFWTDLKSILRQALPHNEWHRESNVILKPICAICHKLTFIPLLMESVLQTTCFLHNVWKLITTYSLTFLLCACVYYLSVLFQSCFF